MKVVVLGGGRSSEHEVSLESAKAVREGLREAGHEVHYVEISRDGHWRHDDKEIHLHPGHGLLNADVAFPVLHGPYGEDGTVQGLLEQLDIAYVGSGSHASAACMDKAVFKDWMRLHEVTQVRYVVLRSAPAEHETKRIGELGWPVFVKPSRLGSSVGISKAENQEQLDAAIKEAFKHDSTVLVEAASGGREIECAVLGVKELQVSEPGEVLLKGADWYDYEAKYTPGGMELAVPARVSDAVREDLKRTAAHVFRLTGCSGMARVDFFVEGDRVLVNEINTIPGFTKTSVYPKLMEASGVPFTELLDRLLEDARADYRHYRQYEH